MSAPATKAAVTALSAENVWKSYDGGAIRVLRGIDLAIGARRTVALCGSSGSGKSTLLHLFGGLDSPDEGRIRVNDIEVNAGRDLLRLMRREVGFVFQLHNLIADLTVEENCLIPAIAAGMAPEARRARLEKLAARTGMTHRLKQRVARLSGGERQRTALVRALMNSPKILLADEPTGSLDERTSATVFELLLETVAGEGLTLLMATHDRGLARQCDLMLEMRDGRI